MSSETLIRDTAWWGKIDPNFGLQSWNIHFWIAHSKGFQMRYKRKSSPVPTHNINFFSKFSKSSSSAVTQFSAILFYPKMTIKGSWMTFVLINFFIKSFYVKLYNSEISSFLKLGLGWTKFSTFYWIELQSRLIHGFHSEFDAEYFFTWKVCWELNSLKITAFLNL